MITTNRIIAPKNIYIENLQNVSFGIVSENSNINYNYKIHRYVFGVCEGVEEIQPSSRFPFELNCDYLNGISFNKGCYLGQEFTARTYHTGTIRKRIMPVIIHPSSDVQSIKIDNPILNEKNQIIGKIMGIEGNFIFIN